MESHTGQGDELSACKKISCLTRTSRCPWTATSTPAGATAGNAITYGSHHPLPRHPHPRRM